MEHISKQGSEHGSHNSSIFHFDIYKDESKHDQFNQSPLENEVLPNQKQESFN